MANFALGGSCASPAAKASGESVIRAARVNFMQAELRKIRPAGRKFSCLGFVRPSGRVAAKTIRADGTADSPAHNQNDQIRERDKVEQHHPTRLIHVVPALDLNSEARPTRGDIKYNQPQGCHNSSTLSRITMREGAKRNQQRSIRECRQELQSNRTPKLTARDASGKRK